MYHIYLYDRKEEHEIYLTGKEPAITTTNGARLLRDRLETVFLMLDMADRMRVYIRDDDGNTIL